MDYLYSQLPEIVYDPADLTGKSPKGTMQLNIDNVKREIILDVLKTPGKLTIKDPNNISYEYDGSKDAEIDISAFFDVKIEYKTATTEDINNGIPTSNSKVGDGYLQVESSGNVAYAPIPTPVTSSDIQKITSTETIYNKVEELPNTPIGSIYPVMQDIGGGHKGIVLYEKKESGYVEKSRVSRGNVYVVLDSGLLAIASTNLEFKTLDGALKGVQVSLTEEIEKLKSSKQDSLEFTDTYNAEDNRVVVESTLNEVAANTALGLSSIEESIATLDTEVKESILNIDAKVDGNKISKIEAVGRDDDITHYKVSFQNEKVPAIGFDAWTPKGDTGTLEINQVFTGDPGTEASVVNVNSNEFTRDSHAILDITIPRGYNADIKNVNVVTGAPGTEASASTSVSEGYLPGQVDLNITIPRGDKGDAASIGVGATNTLNPGQNATVNIVGTSTTTDANGNPIYNDAILQFGIPAGKPAIIKEVTINDGAPGSQAVVTSNCVETSTNTETSIDITIPVGKPAEVQVGNVTTGKPGTNVVVTASNPDYQTDKVVTTLDFTIPQGAQGEVGPQGPQGETGEAATITIGKVEVGENNNTASVINAGTSGNAILNFVIPKGEKGTTITGATSNYKGEDKSTATETEIIFSTNDGTTINPVTVYADRGQKGDTGVGISSITAGETTSDAQGYSVTPLTITKTDSTSNAVNVKAKDGISLSHEWDGTSLIVTSSNGTSEAVDLKGEKGDSANVVVGTTVTSTSDTASVSSAFDPETNTTTLNFVIPKGPQGEPGDSFALAGIFDSSGKMEEDLALGAASEIAPGNFVLLSVTIDDDNDDIPDRKENTLYIKTYDEINTTYSYELISNLGDIKTPESLAKSVDPTFGTTYIRLVQNDQPMGDGVELNIPEKLMTDPDTGMLYLATSTGTQVGNSIKLPATGAKGMVTDYDSELGHTSIQLVDDEGNDIGSPAYIENKGAVQIAASLNEDKTKVFLQLKDKDNNPLGTQVEIPAGTGTGGGPGVGSNSAIEISKIEPNSTPNLIKGNSKENWLNYFIKLKLDGEYSQQSVNVQYQIAKSGTSSYVTMASFNLDEQFITLEDSDKKMILLDLNNGITKIEGSSGIINTFSIKNYISYGNSYTLKVLVSTLDGTTQASKTKAFNAVEYSIVQDPDFNYKSPYINSTTIPFKYSVLGANKLNSNVIGNVYNQHGEIISTYSKEGINENSNTGKSNTYSINMEGQPQGIYKIVMECYSGDGENRIYTNPLTMLIMYSKEDISGNTNLIATNFNYSNLTYGDLVRYNYATYKVGSQKTDKLITQVFGYDEDSGTNVLIESFEDLDLENNSLYSRIINVGASKYYKYVDKDDFAKNKVYEKLVFVFKSGDSEISYEANFNELITNYDVNIYRGEGEYLCQIAPNGQANSEINKNSLSSSYILNGVEVPVPVKMEDFNFISNGFMIEGSNNFVRLNGDAKIKIELPIFETSYNIDGKTVVLNSTAARGRTVEFKFKISNCTDSKQPIISYYKELTVGNATSYHGFEILPTQAYLVNGMGPKYPASGLKEITTNADKIAVTNYSEGELIRLTFVVDPTLSIGKNKKQALKIYINGELARISPIDSCDYTNKDLPGYITIGNSYAQIDLYSATFYQVALNDSQILQNYFADTTYINDRINLHVQNDLLNNNGLRAGYNRQEDYDISAYKDIINTDFMLDYEKCRNVLPCIVIKGQMPKFKDDKQKVAVTITKPDGNGSFIQVVKSTDTNEDGDEYLNDIDVQGTTSAKEYPRYNYKIKLKTWVDSNGKIVIDKDIPNSDGSLKEIKEVKKLKVYLTKENKISNEDSTGTIPGESTLCWKADMMSPDHANTVNGLWFDELFPAIPPNEVPGNKMKYHPTVWGFRCLMFHETDDGKYSFLGDGCLNNDKGNSNTFGLENKCDTKASDIYWSENSTTVSEFEYTDKGETDVVAVLNSNGDIETKCQKWEFKDNSPDLCNFKTYKFFNKAYDYDEEGNVIKEYGHAVLQALESTYPDEGDIEDWGKTPNYTYIQLLYLWVCKRANFWDKAKGSSEYESKKAIFRNEFTKHFNMDHTTSYYIALQITGLVDNHAKNMFLTTYNTQETNVVFTQNHESGINSLAALMNYAKTHDGEIPEDCINWEESIFCKWYPTAYDLDSCYGVDNKGFRRFPYNADLDSYRYDDSSEGYLINGNDSYLWQMFKEVFFDEIKARYQNLVTHSISLGLGKSTNALSLENWKRHMIENNIDTVPPIVTTEDSIFKYVMPWWFGYSKKEYSDPTDYYLYLVKSNRRFDDIEFMKKRFTLYSSLYEASDFINEGTAVSLKLSIDRSAMDYDYLEVKYDQDLYGKIKWDTNSDVSSIVPGEGFLIPNINFTSDKQSVYLYGAKNITEIKNLHQIGLYAALSFNLPKLKVLDFGAFDDTVYAPLTELPLNNCPMLETLDISGCKNLPSLNLTNNLILKYLTATGCDALTNISFADGGQLTEVILPSITNLKIKGQNNLTKLELSSWENITSIFINGNYGTLYKSNDSTEYSLVDLLINRIGENKSDIKLSGLRLENVNLDVSNHEDWELFVNCLSDDEWLYGLQLDSSGNNVVALPDSPSTNYPIITGTLNINHFNDFDLTGEEKEQLDLKITKIIKRYPDLHIAPPPTSDIGKDFNDYYWSEIYAICDAAKRNILEDANGNIVNIDTWFGLGNAKQDSKNGIYLRFVDYDNPEVVDSKGNPFKLNFITGNSNTFFSDKVWNANTEKKCKGKLKITCLDVNKQIISSLEPTECDFSTSSSFSVSYNFTGLKYLKVDVLEKSFITSIAKANGNTFMLNQPSIIDSVTGEPINTSLSYKHLGYDKIIRDMPFPKKESLSSKITLNGNEFEVDCSLGSCVAHGYVSNNTTTFHNLNLAVQSLEFNPGVSFIISVGTSVTLNIKADESIDVGYAHSTIHRDINSEEFLQQTFSEAFLNIIGESYFKANIGRLSNDVEIIHSKTYLPSLTEVGGNTSSAYKANPNSMENEHDSSYGLDSIKSTSDLKANAWLRSPAYYTKEMASYINGSLAYDTGAYSIGKDVWLRFNV